jgi:hypothetical protein
MIDSVALTRQIPVSPRADEVVVPDEPVIPANEPEVAVDQQPDELPVEPSTEGRRLPMPTSRSHRSRRVAAGRGAPVRHPIDDHVSARAAYIWALIDGFSERYVVRLIDQVEASAYPFAEAELREGD